MGIDANSRQMNAGTELNHRSDSGILKAVIREGGIKTFLFK